jgi:hypothetical protein
MKRLVDTIIKIGIRLLLLPIILLYILPIHLFYLVTGKRIKEVKSK